MKTNRISLFKTAMLLLRTYRRNGLHKRIQVFQHTTIDIDTNAKITIDSGKLSINRSWNRKGSYIPFLFYMGSGAHLIIKHSFDIYSGGKIYVNDNATLQLGSGYINHNCNISVFEKVVIGNDCVISENVVIRDSDNHSIDGSSKNKTSPITIGNHVWIGTNCTILKGVTIGDGAVVAAGSVVINDVPSKTLVGGIPARIKKQDISWH